MQKKARARRAILGGDSDATAGACAARANADPMTLRHQRDQATLLSPVSSIGVKLDSMCHWNGTPGAPVGHPRAMDAANPGAMFIERARVNPDSSSGPPTAEQTTEARPAGYYPPTTVAPANRRGHVERDLAPIRSNNGLSFADMLARNGGTRPDADARHHPPSLTRVVQFFNFQRSPACAKSFSSKEFPTALTGPAPFNTHTEDPGADPELLGAKRKAPSTIAGPESLLESPPYTSAVRRRDSESVQMCTPSTADSSPMATHHHAYSGTEVNTVGTNIDGQNTAVQGAFSPLQEGPPSILPYDIDPEHGLPHVSGESLCATLQRTAAGAMRAHVIDCRYPHEFDGGHVRGAVNIHDPAALQRYLCALLAEDADRAQFLLNQSRVVGSQIGSSQSDAMNRGVADEGTVARSLMAHAQNSAFILYCDFSGERAPRMWRHVRNLDRRDHVMDYPSLSFPHMYVLRGGYAGFVSKAEQQGWCTGPHVRVDQPSFVELSRRCASVLRNGWHLARMSKGIGDIPVEDRADEGALDDPGCFFGGGTTRMRSRVFDGEDAFDDDDVHGGGWRGRWEMRDEPVECFGDDMCE